MAVYTGFDYLVRAAMATDKARNGQRRRDAEQEEHARKAHRSKRSK